MRLGTATEESFTLRDCEGSDENDGELHSCDILLVRIVRFLNGLCQHSLLFCSVSVSKHQHVFDSVKSAYFLTSLSSQYPSQVYVGKFLFAENVRGVISSYECYGLLEN